MKSPRPAQVALALALTIAGSAILASCESTSSSSGRKKSSAPQAVTLRRSTGGF